MTRTYLVSARRRSWRIRSTDPIRAIQAAMLLRIAQYGDHVGSAEWEVKELPTIKRVKR